MMISFQVSLESQIDSALCSGDYQTIINLCQIQLESRPELLNSYWYLGLAYFLQGDEEEAQSIWLNPLLEGILDSSLNWQEDFLWIIEKVLLIELDKGNFLMAKKLQDIIQEIDSGYCNEILNEALQLKVKQLSAEGISFLLEMQLVEASNKLNQALKLDSNNPELWGHLANVYLQMELYEEAHKAIEIALKIEQNQFLYYTLGLILEKLNDQKQAILNYQKAIQLDSKYLNAYVRLGQIYAQQENLQSEEQMYRRAITEIPEHYSCFLNLANLLLEQVQRNSDLQTTPEELGAICQLYQQALCRHKNEPAIYRGLAEIYRLLKQRDQQILYLGELAYSQSEDAVAVQYYLDYYQQHPEDVSIYDKLFVCYKHLGEYEKAITIKRQEIHQFGHQTKYYNDLINLYHESLEIDNALTIINEAKEKIPQDSLYFQSAKQWILPIIYKNTEEIDYYRQHFTEHLERFIEQSGIKNSEKLSPEQIQNLANLVGNKTNFYLQYQGKNDLSLQRQYGEFVFRILGLRFPHLTQPLLLSPGLPCRKIRVGYLSASMYHQSAGRTTFGWLKYADHSQFEIYTYAINSQFDNMTEKYRLFSDHFKYLAKEDVSEVAKLILKDRLDILVLPDIGMTPIMTIFAGLRLAPIQCTTWGHPITSGLPTIDYFLSADGMEPHNGETHYTEQLVRLPHIGVAYEKPIIPLEPRSRSDFGFSSHAILYLSCQSSYKYLPQYDYVFARIALGVSDAQFIFVESGHSQRITQIFKNRLHQVFDSVGLDVEQYCKFVPRLKARDFLSLHLMSDIFLDTFAWSGCNSALEAVACGLPMVTCPGEFMRGRHAYAILQQLGIEETIATDEENYIQLAIKLGVEKSWRESIKEKIQANHHQVFERQEVVTALEEFYHQAIQQCLLSNTGSLLEHGNSI